MTVLPTEQAYSRAAGTAVMGEDHGRIAGKLRPPALTPARG